jgi:hypothetical protein
VSIKSGYNQIISHQKETNSLYSTNIKTQLSNIIYTEWSCSFITSASITEVQARVTDQMIYQRHVAGFLICPVGGVRFNLQKYFNPSHVVHSILQGVSLEALARTLMVSHYCQTADSLLLANSNKFLKNSVLQVYKIWSRLYICNK